MEKEELPLGFGFALALNQNAMTAFSQMPEVKKTEILQKAHSVKSKKEMQSLVNGLSAQD